MKLLLDNHTLLWLSGGDAKLTERAADTVADPEALLFLSPASCWELGIKLGLGKSSWRNRSSIICKRR